MALLASGRNAAEEQGRDQSAQVIEPSLAL